MPDREYDPDPDTPRPKRTRGASSGRESPETETPEAQARTRALRLLARREKSRAQLERALLRAGYPREAVGAALDDLEKQGLVDDFRFCRLYLGEQSRLRPRSPRLMRHDLGREGVRPEVIETVMEEMAADLDESALALAAARKKLRGAGSDPERLRRLLDARGFGRAAVEEALRTVLPGARE